MGKPVRVVVISDLHSGHAVGLTPPEHEKIPAEDSCEEWKHLYLVRRALWDNYAQMIAQLKPIDVLIVNGDMIDGVGHRSGGLEQITVDRQEQAKCAAAAIAYCGARQIYGTYGTSYHTGEEEDWENDVAAMCGMKSLDSHAWIDVNGLVFDCKHHLSSGGVPAGRHSAVAKERMWNIYWNEFGDSPKGGVYIRSHVHYHNYCGGHGWLGMSTPALQGLGSKYGARRCSGTVDFGLVHFDVNGREDYQWHAHIRKIPEQAARVMKVELQSMPSKPVSKRLAAKPPQIPPKSSTRAS